MPPKGDYAYPAINVTSIVTINGALKAFADKKSDGIIQVSTGGGEFASGTERQGHGASAPSCSPRRRTVSPSRYNVLDRAAHRPLPAEEGRGFLKPLIAETARAPHGRAAATCSSRTCSTARELPLDENMELSQGAARANARATRSSSRSKPASSAAKRTASTTPTSRPRSSTPRPKTCSQVVRGARTACGRYMFAATFGNVHGVYKPGAVKLRPDILKRRPGGRRSAKYGKDAEFDLVFHGGSRHADSRRSARRWTTAS